MASGEVVIQSMWSPAVAAVRSKGIACTFQPLKEGYRAWGGGFGVAKHVSGTKLDAAYEFINWYPRPAGPAPTSTARATTAPCSRPPRRNEAYEWAYWMEGKPADAGHQAPERRADGEGRRRARRRLATRTAWAASRAGTRVMDENAYMVQQVERVHRCVT